MLAAASLGPALAGVAGRGYLVFAAVSGAVFVGASLRGLSQAAPPTWARRLFLGSILHLTSLFVVLILDACERGRHELCGSTALDVENGHNPDADRRAKV